MTTSIKIKDITDADVLAWIHLRALELKGTSGSPHTTITVTCHEMGPGSLAFCVHAHGACEYGESYADAATKLIARIGAPAKLAADKRAAAERLLAEATALEAAA